MRPIHVAQLDKARPVLVLTRELVRPHMSTVTVAPITTTIRGLSTEIQLGTANGLDARASSPAITSRRFPLPLLADRSGTSSTNKRRG